jgi:Gnt-I system low-affinity gluconate transporter
MDYSLLLAVFAGIAVLMILILYFKIHAFMSLLVVTMLVGVLAGMPATSILETIKTGMGGTLGFVATVVGLGALFGAILEKSGGAQRLASWLLGLTGIKRAPWAMLAVGFLVAIPVFFDVAFIILVPVAFALQRKTKKSLMLFALPLLVGLAITHAFIPPTPGPVAVAEILGADIGWVIVFGFIAGVPTAIICGIFLAGRIARKMHIEVPTVFETTEYDEKQAPSPAIILSIIALPIALIVINTLLHTDAAAAMNLPKSVFYVSDLIGHPFGALILANLFAWYLLGIRRGFTKEQLLDISTQSIYPAGVIILLTGAGGAFKQILVDTGAGAMIGNALNSDFFPPILFAFVIAALVRILQGSMTVAMITAAGITAPVITELQLGDAQKAILVISIASGASILSHVNDSGFWLVKQYLGLDEKQTFRSWTMLTLYLALCGLGVCVMLWYLV